MLRPDYLSRPIASWATRQIQKRPYKNIPCTLTFEMLRHFYQE